MKRLTLLIALLLTVGFASAQNYMVVNSEKIFKSIEAYNEAIADLDKTAKEYQKQVDEKFQSIEVIYQEYMRQQDDLSSAQKRGFEEAILQREKEAEQLRESLFGKEGALMKRRMMLIKPIQTKVFAVIETYAKEEGKEVVLDSSNNQTLLYYQPSAEKTDAIISLLKGNN